MVDSGSGGDISDLPGDIGVRDAGRSDSGQPDIGGGDVLGQDLEGADAGDILV